VPSMNCLLLLLDIICLVYVGNEPGCRFRSFSEFGTIMFKLYLHLGIGIICFWSVFLTNSDCFVLLVCSDCTSFNGMQHLFRRCYLRIKVKV
jgi:hypothetical protein